MALHKVTKSLRWGVPEHPFNVTEVECDEHHPAILQYIERIRTKSAHPLCTHTRRAFMLTREKTHFMNQVVDSERATFRNLWYTVSVAAYLVAAADPAGRLKTDCGPSD
jgi:hypothetical protein